MSDARATILQRLRLAQRTGRIPAGADRLKPMLPGTRPIAERVARFLKELGALGVECHVETSPAAVRDRVGALVGDQLVLSWDVGCLPYGVGSVLGRSLGGDAARDRQMQAEIGVTGCDAAIAETGSLVLMSGDGRPRAASLLPPVHIAIVRPNDVRFTLGEYFSEGTADIGAASCCTIVTGPSRTADIELTLTIGVHGPGRVIVVIGP